MQTKIGKIFLNSDDTTLFRSAHTHGTGRMHATRELIIGMNPSPTRPPPKRKEVERSTNQSERPCLLPSCFLLFDDVLAFISFPFLCSLFVSSEWAGPCMCSVDRNGSGPWPPPRGKSRKSATFNAQQAAQTGKKTCVDKGKNAKQQSQAGKNKEPK
mmetsp:Transcript_31218/g.61621  ORF Transcript_31218/g.61621 Transcript_31218/m.61621 type:complete len:157 (-) Transcript_31218:288-758(-)